MIGADGRARVSALPVYKTAALHLSYASVRAFSSEVDTGSRQENASKQESGAPFRFHRNGKGSRNLQTAGIRPANGNTSLPETTVCRPTEGDQYRISGPSYVLAGTAILNSKNRFK